MSTPRALVFTCLLLFCAAFGPRPAHQPDQPVALAGCGGAAAVPVIVGSVGAIGACILDAILVKGATSAGQVLADCVGSTLADVVAIAGALLTAYAGDAGVSPTGAALPPASPDLIGRLRKIAAGR